MAARRRGRLDEASLFDGFANVEDGWVGRLPVSRGGAEDVPPVPADSPKRDRRSALLQSSHDRPYILL